MIGRLLQWDETTWSTVEYQEFPGRAMTVFFAYAIFIWNRFGILSVSSPRAPLRFLLIGLYSWMALALIAWFASQRTIHFRSAATATAIIHIPLVALGFFMAIVAGFARILGPGFILAVLVVCLWMPALLVRLFSVMAGWRLRDSIVGAILVQALWMLGPGWFIYRQVGHLL